MTDTAVFRLDQGQEVRLVRIGEVVDQGSGLIAPFCRRPNLYRAVLRPPDRFLSKTERKDYTMSLPSGCGLVLSHSEKALLADFDLTEEQTYVLAVLEGEKDDADLARLRLTNSHLETESISLERGQRHQLDYFFSYSTSLRSPGYPGAAVRELDLGDSVQLLNIASHRPWVTDPSRNLEAIGSVLSYLEGVVVMPRLSAGVFLEPEVSTSEVCQSLYRQNDYLEDYAWPPAPAFPNGDQVAIRPTVDPESSKSEFNSTIARLSRRHDVSFVTTRIDGGEKGIRERLVVATNGEVITSVVEPPSPWGSLPIYQGDLAERKPMKAGPIELEVAEFDGVYGLVLRPRKPARWSGSIAVVGERPPMETGRADPVRRVRVLCQEKTWLDAPSYPSLVSLSLGAVTRPEAA